jgi:glucokinase
VDWLVADIGGTNTRCAVGGAEGALAHVATFRNREHPGLGELLAGYLAGLPAGVRPRRAALAVAAPIQGRRVRMINLDWEFSTDDLATRLGLADVRVLNDFTALAWSLPVLGPADLVQVGGTTARPRAAKVVIGPGTGLGAAGLVPVEPDGWVAVPGEGGHATLPAGDDAEADLIRRARDRYGHCSAERLIAGPGMAVVHELLHGATLTPEAITTAAAAGDAAALATVTTCFRLLGTVAGNLALAFGAFGGVYIGGGVVPRQVELFARSGFRERFEAKGRYREYLAPIPVYVIVARYPALAGLLAWTARL